MNDQTECGPQTPARTAEDARYRPVPGDRMVYEGITYIVERVGAGIVRSRATGVEQPWTHTWSTGLWSIDDGDSTWIPAGAE